MCASINRADPNPANARAAYLPPLRESFIMDLRPKLLVIVGAAACALLSLRPTSPACFWPGSWSAKASLLCVPHLVPAKRLVRQQLAQALLLSTIGTVSA